MKIQKLLFAAFILFASSNAFAQNDTNEDSHTLSISIPEVALLDIESSTNNTAISLEATAPTEAGEKINLDKSNSDLWLNYSSIVGNKSSRTVTVQITDGDVPAGANLTVAASQFKGNGEGTMGKANDTGIILSSKKAQNLIEGIGSAYTGNGAQGHNLTYKLTQIKGEYAKLNFDESTNLTITYTLTDN
ncbi:hypothetical protein [Lutibacter citreus]|uniref:hypothetical protein n=1 Tax=Lutibacter citreus TaxID=2138210 RepID=UPI000DBE75DD|nr:hypothetical protein [Lutibacter citreus]